MTVTLNFSKLIEIIQTRPVSDSCLTKNSWLKLIELLHFIISRFLIILYLGFFHLRIIATLVQLPYVKWVFQTPPNIFIIIMLENYNRDCWKLVGILSFSCHCFIRRMTRRWLTWFHILGLRYRKISLWSNIC